MYPTILDAPTRNVHQTMLEKPNNEFLPRTSEHNSKDEKSHVLIHSKKTKHRWVFLQNVQILGRGYRTNFRRKISEALYIKELEPDLNVQKEAYKLKLFN